MVPGMAEIVSRVDDIDNSVPAVDTVQFSFRGETFELDLGAESLAAFQESADYWTAHARKLSARAASATKGKGKGRGGATDPDKSSDAQKARDWARAQGIEVSARGRVPAEIMSQYLDATKRNTPAGTVTPQAAVASDTPLIPGDVPMAPVFA